MKKYNIHFFENRNIYFTISLVIFLIGILCNVFMGTNLDIQFRGGAILKYSYSGQVDPQVIASAAEEVTGISADVRLYNDVKVSADKTQNQISISFAGSQSLSLEQQKALTEAVEKTYPDAAVTVVETSSVNPTMGQQFFAKCLISVAITFLLLVAYVAFRFRKIGGASAGVMAIIALLHDVLVIYFAFVIFQMPINDSFIAVVLTILGYSLNDTIVIYDRIRENRKILGPKTETSVLVNTSINQTFTRSVNTSICTFIAIAVVYVVGMIYGLSSVTAFAFPMMVGVITGCYSSVCIAGPLYVMWQNHKAKKTEKAKEAR